MPGLEGWPADRLLHASRPAGQRCLGRDRERVASVRRRHIGALPSPHRSTARPQCVSLRLLRQRLLDRGHPSPRELEHIGRSDSPPRAVRQSLPVLGLLPDRRVGAGRPRGESVAQPDRRPDLQGKLTAALPYPTDVRSEEGLIGGVLWSAWPAARITAIDTAAAEALRDVVAVITHRDLPGRNSGGMSVFGSDQPVLAASRVRTMSDAVAVVAARSQSGLRAALRAIRVDYDRERPVTTIEEALEAARRRSPGGAM